MKAKATKKEKAPKAEATLLMEAPIKAANGKERIFIVEKMNPSTTNCKEFHSPYHFISKTKDGDTCSECFHTSAVQALEMASTEIKRFELANQEEKELTLKERVLAKRTLLRAMDLLEKASIEIGALADFLHANNLFDTTFYGDMVAAVELIRQVEERIHNGREAVEIEIE